MVRVGAIRYAARDPYTGACSTSIGIPMLDRGPLAIEGLLGGWLGRLSAALAVVVDREDPLPG